MVKMVLTFPEDSLKELKEKAVREGFLKPTVLARYLIMRSLKSGMRAEFQEADGRHTYQLDIEEPNEIEAYVKAKRFDSVSSFAKYAMEVTMSRAPLTEAQKDRVKRNRENETNIV